MSLVPTSGDFLVCRNDGPGSACLHTSISDVLEASRDNLRLQRMLVSEVNRKTVPARLTIQVSSVASDFGGFGFEADDGFAVPICVAAHCRTGGFRVWWWSRCYLDIIVTLSLVDRGRN